MICARCKKEVSTFRMSFFNEDYICLKCVSIEEEHPQYEYARMVERKEVEKGNYNYKGIGLPEDFNEFMKKHNI